jgi:hypothetical protein
MARGVDSERCRDGFGRYMPDRRQLPTIGTDGEPGDAVVPPVADIEELSRRREVDLRTRVAHGLPGGQRCDRLHRRESACRPVQAIAGYAAALLVREVDEIEARMETIVAWAEASGRFDPEWRIGGQMAGLRIEPELRNKIGAGIILGRLQDIVVEAGDVRHKGELVGGVSLDGMGAVGRVLPIEGWCAHCTVISERMDRRTAALIIGG